MAFAGCKEAGGFANATHFADRGKIVGYMKEDLVVRMMSKVASGKVRPLRILAVWKVRLLGGFGELEARVLAREITASEASTPVTEPFGT